MLSAVAKAGLAAFAASSLLRGAHAAPAEKRNEAGWGTSVTINFDNIFIIDPYFHFQSMPPFTAPSSGATLLWPSFGVSILGANTGIQTGVPAHSSTQAAALVPAVHARANPFQPSPLIPALTPSANTFATATGNLTVGTAASFDLKSFWWGCSLATFTSVASAPQACQFDVFAYKSADGVPALATFVFWGNGVSVKADMVQAVLPADGRFAGLKNVQFVRRVVGPLDAATESVVMDDVEVVVY